MNNKVFISGKVTGDLHYRGKFEGAVYKILSANFFNRHGSAKLASKYGRFGFMPVNPCDFRIMRHPLEECSWSLCMLVCLWHLTGCSYIYMLNNWRDSRGARIEHRWAKFLHKHIIYQP